jgi:serine/threonine-protein kinase
MTYEMLVGKYPFEANTAWEWASKHMTEAPRPIETQALGQHVPEKMRNAIKRALEKNKDDRFGSVKEYFEAITGGGAPAHTSVMNEAPKHEAQAADAMPAGNRAKTEMGAPVAMDGGPPAGAMTPPYGPPMGPPPGAPMGGPAVVPQGPMHAPAKKGGNGLVIGLAVLAVLLIGGGGLAYALRGKPKPIATDLTDLNASATSSASAAPVETATTATTDDADASVAPLGGAIVTTAVGAKTGTSGGTAAKPTSSAKPVPTPTPKADPAICAAARSAAKRGSPSAPGLAKQCQQAGGTL